MIVGLLVLAGFLMIASAGIVLSQTSFNQPYFFLKNQLIRGLSCGLVFGLIMFLLPLKLLRKFSLFLFLINIALLVLVFVPGVGIELGGAKRWINIGFAFQPAEPLKFSLVLYLAAWLSKKKEQLKGFKDGFLPFLLLLGLLGLLIGAQPDIGTFGIVALTAVLMLVAAGAPLWQFASLGGLALLAIPLLIKIYPHVAARITAFFHPAANSQTISYQINQAIIAIGSGGIIGVGLGQSLQRYLYLPEPVGDSIVAIIGEEFGFIGLLGLVVLFGIFVWRGIKIAKNAPGNFARLLALGLVSWIALQAIINIAAISGLTPLTGIPLPFISYGSSALVVALTSVGLLLNISKRAKI